MMFKNENEVVAKKAERRYATLAKQKEPRHSDKKPDQTSDTDDTDSNSSIEDFNSVTRNKSRMVPVTRFPTPDSMVTEINPSIEDQAHSWFVTNYVTQPSIVPRGELDWIVELLSHDDVNESIRRSFDAASLAGLANSSKSPIVLRKAQTAYGEALRMTNTALRGKCTALTDSTLMSVIMLGVYEYIVFQGNQPTEAWAKHVAGACTLLKLRGKEQFESSFVRRIFHDFFATILIVSLESGIPVHKGVYELYEAINPSSNYEVHGRQWTLTIVAFMHDFLNFALDKKSDPVTMVTKAMKMDKELSNIKVLVPDIWQFDIINLEGKSKYFYGKYYHVYMDPWIASMWNYLRSTHILLHKILRENIIKGCKEYKPPLFPMDEVGPQREVAEQTIHATLGAVIASVPQITGMTPFPKMPVFKGSSSRSVDPKKQLPTYQLHSPGTFLDRSKGTRLTHLIWPLHTVGTSEYCNFEMRQWCIEILHFIALRTGTRQAVVRAEELKRIQAQTAPAYPPSPASSTDRISPAL